MIYGLAASVCDASLGVKPNCQDARGGVFSNYTSTTWEQGLQYNLDLDTNLGESGVGQYGSFAPSGIEQDADILQASILSGWDIQIIQAQRSPIRLFLPLSPIPFGLVYLDLASNLRTFLDTVIRRRASLIVFIRMDPSRA